jgi:hypothetical protein
MTPEFNRWWDADELSQTNPYDADSPAYWAWEGWLAAQEAQRERCANEIMKYAHNAAGLGPEDYAEFVRALGDE